jgi:hypothetical protein
MDGSFALMVRKITSIQEKLFRIYAPPKKLPPITKKISTRVKKRVTMASIGTRIEQTAGFKNKRGSSIGSVTD